MERGDVVAAQAMRRILCRLRKAAQHANAWGWAKAISLDKAKLVPDDRGSDLLLLDSTEG